MRVMLKNIFLSLILSKFLFSFHAIAQYDFESIIKYRNLINKEFKDSTKSPLNKGDISNFEELDYFDIDTSYCVIAFFKRTPYEIPFTMKTTSTRNPLYVKFGELSFTLNSKQFKLNIYQNVDPKSNLKSNNMLFLPFTDKSNGNTTYGGGRYIDIPIPIGEIVILDFNKAYNPYCAYNHSYSCPIPPEENNIEIEIKAGVKTFKKKSNDTIR